MKIVLGYVEENAMKRIEAASLNEEIVFVITSTMKKNAQYEPCYLASTENRIILCENGEVEEILISSFEKMYITRMYGNSTLNIKYETNERMIFRFSNDVLSMCEAVCEYINNVKQGKDRQEQYEVLESVYMKQRAYCEKCGRALRTPGAEIYTCRIFGAFRRCNCSKPCSAVSDENAC